MLAVSDAQRTILEHCTALPAELLPLSAGSLGRVLAEDVASDLDLPPFDKALMDGYAVRSADLATGHATLVVLEEITAGRTPTHTVGPGQASRIMTGAPIPPGADAVVVVERTRLIDPTHVQIEDRPAKPGQNLLPRAREMTAGEVVLKAGTLLRPQELGILAAVGRTSAKLIPPPRVAVLPTGDELVDPPAVPGPGQIRNSNAPMLLAQATRAGAVAVSLGIGRDTVESLAALVRQGLEGFQVLILSGGVSAGKLDLVPGVLQQAGVVAHFHKVHLKPGKPLLFGTCEHPAGRRLVFGLPGNPVSSFVCFELFLRPALRRLAGLPDLDLPRITAQLSEALYHQSDRPTYHPGWVTRTAAGWSVRPTRYFGSADLRAYHEANALCVLPAGKLDASRGDAIDVLLLDG